MPRRNALRPPARFAPTPEVRPEFDAELREARAEFERRMGADLHPWVARLRTAQGEAR